MNFSDLSSSPRITISVSTVLDTVEGAMDKGYSLADLLKDNSIQPLLMSEPKARVTFEQFMTLIVNVRTLLDDELLGLQCRPMRTGMIQIIWLYASHAGTVGGALKRCAEFLNLLDISFKFELIIDGKQAEFRITRIPERKILNRFTVESGLMIWHRFAGWLANERILLNQVLVDYAKSDEDEYQYMFYGAPVLYRQTHNAFQFDAAYLERPIVQNEASIRDFYSIFPYSIYNAPDASPFYTLAVSNLANEHFGTHKSPPSIDYVAEQISIKPQTLRRRLKKEGTTFKEVVAHVRRDRVIHDLSDTTLSIESVAVNAGYSEASAFIRAFKAWTGYTPLAYRKALDV